MADKKSNEIRIKDIRFSKGSTFRERLRLVVALSRFVKTFREATPEGQDAIIDFLGKQPGVTVTRTEN